MVNNNLEVYTDDFGFRVETSAVEEFSRQLKEAKAKVNQHVFEMLDERVFFEHDIHNLVLLTFTKAISDEWHKRGNWDDVEGLFDPIEEGKYDDEMKRYYAYLQAEAILENLELLDFSDEDNIEERLNINGIIVCDDDLMFRKPGVTDFVERTFDLEVDVRRLLLMVIRNLEDTGKTIDFIKGY